MRKGLISDYTVKYIAISWAPGTPNFSSDTEFREILIVAEKGVHDDTVKITNLLLPVEDLNLRDIIGIANLAKKSRGTVFNKENNPAAQIIEIPQEILRRYPENMYRVVAFSNHELLEWHINIVDKYSLRLDSILGIGSVIDHTQGLKVLSAVSIDKRNYGYPVIWGSGRKGVSSPVVKKPEQYIIVEDEKKARVKFWKKRASYFANLFLIRRGQLDTQCVLAFKSKEPVASNVWWPIKLKSKWDPAYVDSFLAFMNSTFGFIHLLAERLETRGLWVEFKKEHLLSTPIPDFEMMKNNGAFLSVDSSILKSVMPKFGDYFKDMAELEKSYGTWIKTAKHISEHKESPLSQRAKLDILVFEFLRKLDPNVESPSQLYQLTYLEI